MRSIALSLICASMAFAGSPPLSAQGVARSDSARFAAEWKVVMERYPTVAMSYLRHQALNYQLALLALAAEQSERGPRESSQEQPSRRLAHLAHWDICGLFRRMGIQPLPAACSTQTVPPIVEFEECFEPQPSSDGKGEMPDAKEANDCLQAALRRGR